MGYSFFGGIYFIRNFAPVPGIFANISRIFAHVLALGRLRPTEAASSGGSALRTAGRSRSVRAEGRMRASILSASQSLCGQRGLLFSFQSARYVNLGFKHRLQKATNRKKQGESPLRAQRRPRPAEYSRIFSCCANLGIFAENITKVSPRPTKVPMSGSGGMSAACHGGIFEGTRRLGGFVCGRIEVARRGASNARAGQPRRGAEGA